MFDSGIIILHSGSNAALLKQSSQLFNSWYNKDTDKAEDISSLVSLTNKISLKLSGLKKSGSNLLKYLLDVINSSKSEQMAFFHLQFVGIKSFETNTAEESFFRDLINFFLFSIKRSLLICLYLIFLKFTSKIHF